MIFQNLSDSYGCSSCIYPFPSIHVHSQYSSFFFSVLCWTKYQKQPYLWIIVFRLHFPDHYSAIMSTLGGWPVTQGEHVLHGKHPRHWSWTLQYSSSQRFYISPSYSASGPLRSCSEFGCLKIVINRGLIVLLYMSVYCATWLRTYINEYSLLVERRKCMRSGCSNLRSGCSRAIIKPLKIFQQYLSISQVDNTPKQACLYSLWDGTVISRSYCPGWVNTYFAVLTTDSP